MNYTLSKFQISQRISDDIFLLSSFVSGCHFLLSHELHELLKGDDNQLNRLQETRPDVFERLLNGRFLIEKERDELAEYIRLKDAEINDSRMFHIIVNPTLDCNLSCWYCYENKVPKSVMSDEVEKAVCKHIEIHYAECRFELLKLSFFGGEPFLRPKVIQSIVRFADKFCKSNNIRLLLDFTTNGTLCTQSILEFLKVYNCMFQITLDGNKEQHNKIKFFRRENSDAYSATIKNIHRIQNTIPNSFVSVRINFDKDTLSGFDAILDDIKSLNRSRTKVILKKIWQVGAEEISNNDVREVFDKLIFHKFVVDYYSQGGVCFADRKNQVTINYDGNVYKCTTISRFNDDTGLGKLNLSDGTIDWNEDRLSYLSYKEPPKSCEKCCMLPSCGGPCRKKAADWDAESCFLNDCLVLS